MRILIDECLNWRLGRALTGHYAVSAQKLGWNGVKNGKLLALAVENGFEAFLTGDRNLTFQQNVTGLPSPLSCWKPRASNSITRCR